MKRHLLATAALALAGCAAARDAAPPARPAAVVASAGTVILSGERAFAAAELAYITAADGAGHLVDAGVIHGAAATRVRAWNSTARTALVAGKAAADTAEKARAAVTLFGLADQLNALIGSR